MFLNDKQIDYRMKTKTKLGVVLIAILLFVTLATAVSQKWVTWTYSYVENGHTNLYKYQRLAPQSCTTSNLACLKLQEKGMWSP